MQRSINVIIANLFAPLSQESTWQRFRAFSQSKIKFDKAIFLSIINAITLWIGLIILAFGLQLVVPQDNQISMVSMSNVLEVIRTLNDWWFPFFVFPIMTTAALSAMFSTADTCVSSLLYLIEYSRYENSDTSVNPNKQRLSWSYYTSMLLIFIVSLTVYSFVRVWFNPTILQLVFSVFSNLIVIAPTVISATILSPIANDQSSQEFQLLKFNFSLKLKQIRSFFITLSLFIGFISYWTSSIIAIVGGQDYLWLSQSSIGIGLIGAILPVLPLWLYRRKLTAEG